MILFQCQFDSQDLTEDPRAELENLLRYLKVEIDEGRLDCIEAHREGKFHRAEKEDQKGPQRDRNKTDQKVEKDPFTAELHSLLDQTIVAADSLLREKIGRGLPVEKYQNFNNLS